MSLSIHWCIASSLTDVAARFADEPANNFDIYLPNCLARQSSPW